MEPNSNPLWTVEEFAQFFRVTRGAAHAMIRRDQLPKGAVARVGRRIRIVSSVIQEWIQKRTA